MMTQMKGKLQDLWSIFTSTPRVTNVTWTSCPSNIRMILELLTSYTHLNMTDYIKCHLKYLSSIDQ